eukprot:15983846-Heterocapsa_arctica.AAC.1
MGVGRTSPCAWLGSALSAQWPSGAQRTAVPVVITTTQCPELRNLLLLALSRVVPPRILLRPQDEPNLLRSAVSGSCAMAAEVSTLYGFRGKTMNSCKSLKSYMNDLKSSMMQARKVKLSSFNCKTHAVMTTCSDDYVQ